MREPPIPIARPSSCPVIGERVDGAFGPHAAVFIVGTPVSQAKTPPILSRKNYEAPSDFKPENLLRGARRQRGLPAVNVPEICILDPDGDVVRHLRTIGRVPR